MLHLYGFSFSWTDLTCCFRWDDLAVAYLQLLHLNLFSWLLSFVILPLCSTSTTLICSPMYGNIGDWWKISKQPLQQLTTARDTKNLKKVETTANQWYGMWARVNINQSFRLPRHLLARTLIAIWRQQNHLKVALITALVITTTHIVIVRYKGKLSLIIPVAASLITTPEFSLSQWNPSCISHFFTIVLWFAAVEKWPHKSLTGAHLWG